MSIKKSYDKWSTTYDSNVNKTRDLDKKVTIDILSKYRFDRVLELGCGTGKNTQFLATKADKIVAVDFSVEMLNKAKEKLFSKTVNFLQADITKNWNFTTQKFDMITCSLTLEHIENLDFIFQQASEKLEKNGLFFISELHPFKQYAGSKARFETGGAEEELDVFIHHTSDFIKNAVKNGFLLMEIDEWFDKENVSELPRLITFLFRRTS